MKTITPMRQWMAAATTAEQELLAERVGTSRAMLYQLAGGFRNASAERAQSIERETRGMARASKGRLPIVYRTDLCEACRGCEFAHRALGDRAVVSEFPIVDPRQLELTLG
jgi:DNA-binding transcriptional regulator YdaS (Cro superfamily)